MKLTRNKVSALIILGLVLVVFNVLAFAIPFTRGATFWIGYGFTFFAILFSAGAALYAIGRQGLKSKFYGLPLLYVAWTYLIIQTVLGFICMAVPFIPWWVALLIGIFLLAAAAIGLVAVDMGREAIEQIDAKVAEKVFYLRSLQVDVETLATRTAELRLKKNLKDLAESIRYSDPMSHERLAALEGRIEAGAARLAEAVESGDGDSAQALVDELAQLLAERNRKSKMMKGM
jgi:hypothetical protein